MEQLSQLARDAKNLGVIGVGTVAALLVTGLLFARSFESERVYVHVDDVEMLEVLHPAGSHVADRLWGTVITKGGESFTGFLVWDRNEASWADLLEGQKGDRTAGIRFGHLASIEPTGSGSARLTLKSGETVTFESNATDIGSAMRGVGLDDADGRRFDFEWSDLALVEFQPPPEEAPEVTAPRLHGTVVTRSGLEFTGHVSWDIEESLITDVVDGRDRRGAEYEIAFGNIASMAPGDGNSSVVTLRSGDVVVLGGSDDVGPGNGGITVSDAALGQVRIEWRNLAEARFHEAGATAAYADFDGGSVLRAEIETVDGDVLEGPLLFDRDEGWSWEMLDGEMSGVDFQIELGNVARIARDGSGAVVELTDGRLFRLTGSNDVDSGNGGVIVGEEGSVTSVAWRDVREVRFIHR